MNWIKKLLGLKNEKQCTISDVSHDFTIGERDEEGFCDVYKDGEKTNVRILTFTSEQVERLQRILDRIYRENNCR